jgi:hypothetical protein
MAVRRKKKGGAWKGFAAGMGIAGIFGLLLMWAVAGPSGTKLREAFRNRMSIMADRADQFVEAWNRRQVPGKPDEKNPASVAPAQPRSNRRTPAAAAPTPTSNSERPVLAPVQPAAPTPIATPAAAPPPPPDKDITPDDQQQLRQLMQKINQGH